MEGHSRDETDHLITIADGQSNIDDTHSLRIDFNGSFIDFKRVTEKHTDSLKLLNAILFPVTYNAQYYKDAVANYSLLAFDRALLIGNCCCRPDAKEGYLYIMTLGVLPRYRKRGIASRMVQLVCDHVQASNQFCGLKLHVQTSNEQALMFYQRLGFSVVERVEKYYKRIEPDSAYLLIKENSK